MEDLFIIGRLLWASDYPHWDTSWPHSVWTAGA